MPSSPPVFSTPLTKQFKISHPVMLAGELDIYDARLVSGGSYPALGMNVAAGPKLAAAVTNAGMVLVSVDPTLYCSDALAGGIGVIGGIHSSAKMLQGMIDELKNNLENKDAPFGVDLALPQVGGNARKTNVCAH